MSTWIPLLVRLEDYAELSQLVAAREAGRPAEADAEAGVVLPRVVQTRTVEPSSAADHLLERLAPWNIEDLRQIIDTAPTYKTMARWARALDVLCERPGPTGWASTAEVASAAGMTINEWRDAPRKLPQHLTAHFPAGIEWPLAAVGGRMLDRDDQVYWGITVEQARRWKLARAQAGQGAS